MIIGKFNLSEWANFRSFPSSSGWSGIGGQTNMAYVLDRNPCGSSSGSAVAVSANLATITVGTETDGSIVCPSGANAVVGIKPTVGLLSRAGIIPISADQDTAGPMTRNVTDAAVMLGAMTGIDSDDPATAGQDGHAFTDYTPFLDDAALDGARIGVWREFAYVPEASPEVDAIMNEAVEVLEAEGAIVVDPTRIVIEDVFGPEFFALACEFKDDIATYLETYTGPGFPKTLEDLIEFNDTHPDLEGPWNSQTFLDAQATGGRADPDCQDAREFATAFAKAAIDDVMEEHDLDAIIAPTNGPAWLTDPVNGDDFTNFVGSSTPSAVSGYASIAVPAGFVSNLPIGAVIHRRPVGRAGADRLRFRLRAGDTCAHPAELPRVDVARPSLIEPRERSAAKQRRRVLARAGQVAATWGPACRPGRAPEKERRGRKSEWGWAGAEKIDGVDVDDPADAAAGRSVFELHAGGR